MKITYQDTVTDEEWDIFSLRIWSLFVDESRQANIDIEDHALRGFGMASGGDGEGTLAEFNTHDESKIFSQMLNLKISSESKTNEKEVVAKDRKSVV